MTHETLTSSQLSFRAAALRMVDLPLSVYSSLAQVSVSTGTKKLVAATAFGAISLLFLARRFQRRKGRKNAQWEPAAFEILSPASGGNGNTGHNITLSLNSKNGYTSGLLHAGDYRKLSGSLLSLASVKSVNSSSSSTCANGSTCWDREAEADTCSVVNLPVTTPENLYLMGMDLFEEALRRWEEALTFRSRQSEDDVSCASVKTGAGDAIAEQSMEDVLSAEFMHRLKSLLQRAYSLQEEFEGVLCVSEPSSHGNSQDKTTDMLSREELDDACVRDSISIASTDSFVSAAELTEYRELRSVFALGHHLFYEEALQMAEDGKISCRVLRTEMLECLGDIDFLAKLHCVRQACQLILCETTTRMFLADTGKKILSSIIVKAQKVSDGFIAHFYAVCEQISPILAWGFLGPKSSLHDFCCFFKDQVLYFLKDVFDLDKVRYSSVESLAEDMLHLLHRRSELLVAYLGADSLRQGNGCSARQGQLEARVQ
ncbi:Mitoguardin-1 [Liparis tanakae]|uniref:Mitoguardin-1 n=1 Tax=Liparis tanakae TaxID=230148 RepID=A0A4Z2JFE4_9TELE|nr:Mitoguardin-1 [Liparis tanakae]